MITLEQAGHLKPGVRRLLADLRDIVRRHVPKASILLYGSVARGESAPDSDYDVLILTPKAMNSLEEAALRRAVYEMEVEQDAVISLIVSTVDDWELPITRATPYYQNVTREGIAVC